LSLRRQNIQKPFIPLLFLWLCFPVSGISQDSLGVRLIGDLQSCPGNRKMITSSEILFALHDIHLNFVDISQPETPEIVGGRNYYNGCYDLVLNEDILYWTTAHMLRAEDISDPENPVLIDTLNPFDGEFNKLVDVSNGLACVYGYSYDDVDNARIALIDISDPHSMQLLSTLEHGYQPEKVKIYDEFVFTLTRGNEIDIIDISDHDAPFYEGSLPDSAGYEWFEINDDNIFITSADSGFLKIYELDDHPLEPSFLTEYQTEIMNAKIEIKGDTTCIYTADEFILLNCADLDSIFEFGHYLLPEDRTISTLTMESDYVFINTGDSLYTYYIDDYPVLVNTPGRIYVDTYDLRFDTSVDTIFNLGNDSLEIEITEVIWTGPQPVGYYHFAIDSLIIPGDTGFVRLNLTEESFRQGDLVTGMVVIESNAPNLPVDTIWIRPWSSEYLISPGFIEFEVVPRDMSQSYQIVNTISNQGIEDLEIEISSIEWLDNEPDRHNPFAYFDRTIDPGDSTRLSLYLSQFTTHDSYSGILVLETNDPLVPVDTIEINGITNVEKIFKNDGLPLLIEIIPPYPNPFNNAITIPFIVPEASMVEMNVYDINGRHVSRLHRDFLREGVYRTQWDGRSGEGIQICSGVFFVRLTSSSGNATKRIILIK